MARRPEVEWVYSLCVEVFAFEESECEWRGAGGLRFGFLQHWDLKHAP